MENMKAMISPETVKVIRETLRMNHQEFADALGISYSSVSRFESGERNPLWSVGALLRVATPEQQAIILEELGVEDVKQFAADILSAAGVLVVDTDDPQTLAEALTGKPPVSFGDFVLLRCKGSSVGSEF